jgi:hypothetical protein
LIWHTLNLLQRVLWEAKETLLCQLTCETPKYVPTKTLPFQLNAEILQGSVLLPTPHTLHCNDFPVGERRSCLLTIQLCRSHNLIIFTYHICLHEICLKGNIFNFNINNLITSKACTRNLTIGEFNNIIFVFAFGDDKLEP